MVDIRTGHVVSESAGRGRSAARHAQGNRLEIVDSGDLVRFEGGVTMTLMLGETADSHAKAGAQ